MKKIRKATAFILAVVMLTVAASCQKEITAQNLMDNVEQGNASEVDLDEGFCKKYSSVAFSLLKNQYSSDGGNIVISPLAVYSHLGLLANGASSNSLSEIENALLGFKDYEALNEYVHTYSEELKNTDFAKFYFQNAVWCNADKNVKLSDEFLSAAKTYYGMDAYMESFGKTAATNINNWASNNTDMNAELIMDDLSSDAFLYCINATVLDADWETPISPENVSDGTFKSSSSNEETVQMMSSCEYVYVGNDVIDGFMKNYSGGNYAFLALIPKTERTPMSYLLEFLSDGSKYRHLISTRKSRVVDAGIPKFSCEYRGGLKDMLESINVTKVFSSTSAALDRVGTADSNLYVEDLNVFAGISVTEKGTRKGTGATIANSNTATGLIPVSLNRPFVFAVVDAKKHLPILVGAVNSVKG